MSDKAHDDPPLANQESRVRSVCRSRGLLLVKRQAQGQPAAYRVLAGPDKPPATTVEGEWGSLDEIRAELKISVVGVRGRPRL